MSKGSIPAAMRRQKVEYGVQQLLEVQPKGFTFLELLAFLGPELEERTVRRQLDRLCDEDVLFGIDRGIFVAGDAQLSGLSDPAHAVDAAFLELGGIAEMAEIIERLPHCYANERLVRNYLSASEKYRFWLPVKGYRRSWHLREDLRQQLPLPGAFQLLELRIMKAKSGSVGQNWGLPELRHFQARVADAVKCARQIAGIEISSLGTREELVDAIRSSFEAGPDAALNWWRSLGDNAFFGFWIALEGGSGNDFAQAALNVRAWEEIGKVLSANPAFLSRGGICPDSLVH